ncbi:PREDICTED: photosystem II reaction center W protein, chloroplastic-like isoform X1 [Nelumbo nucifera]|nr:PREDICTED: photosystem II reaction center W protein, chloroplastic-like isoform X1 [Nelumbo nucifera]
MSTTNQAHSLDKETSALLCLWFFHFPPHRRKMASISASTPTSSVVRGSLGRRSSIGASSSPVLGKLSKWLPAMEKRGRVMCSAEKKPSTPNTRSNVSMNAALMAAATMSSPAALALVDERMSTEGTGLPFGLSNNLLGWILLGVFALIWALYFVYASSLEEDEESGLSL